MNGFLEDFPNLVLFIFFFISSGISHPILAVVLVKTFKVKKASLKEKLVSHLFTSRQVSNEYINHLPRIGDKSRPKIGGIIPLNKFK